MELESSLMITANDNRRAAEKQNSSGCECHRSERETSELSPASEAKDGQRNKYMERQQLIRLHQLCGPSKAEALFFLSAFGWSDEKLVALVTITKLKIHLLVESRRGGYIPSLV